MAVIQSDDTAAQAGEAIGGVLAWLADAANGLWESIGPTASHFIGGVLRGAGLDQASTLELIMVGVGVLLLLAGLRALLDARPFSALITAAIGAAAIAWAIA